MAAKLKNFEKTQAILREGILADGFNAAITEIFYTFKDIIKSSLANIFRELYIDKYMQEELTAQSFLQFIEQVVKGKEFESETKLYNYLYTIHRNYFTNLNKMAERYSGNYDENYMVDELTKKNDFKYLDYDNLEQISEEFKMPEYFYNFKRYKQLCYKLLTAKIIDNYKYEELIAWSEYNSYSEPALRKQYSRCLKHLKESYFQSLKMN